MEHNRDTFTNLLNTPISGNENPSSQDYPNFSQSPNFSQTPNFSQNSNFNSSQNPNFSQTPNFPQNPNFSQMNPNFPYNPNFSMHPNMAMNPNFPYNVPMNSNFWPQQTQPSPHPPFSQNPRGPRPRNAPIVDLGGDDVIEEAGEGAARRMWTEDEDVRLMAAYLTVSVDSVVGNDQTARTFWNRITTYFNENGGGSERRSWAKCKARFHKMSPAVTKFNCIYNQRALRWQSGASDDQILEDAREQYKAETKKPFNLVRVWKMVRENPKWKGQAGFEASYQSRKKTRTNEAGDYSSSPQPETPMSQQESTTEPQVSQPGWEPSEPIEEEPPQPQRRPIGQKAAKRKEKGKKKVGQTSTGSYASDASEQLAAYQEKMAVEFQSFNRNNEGIKMELERQNRINERQERKQAMWEYNALLNKDTSGMTPEALQMHEKLKSFYRQEYGWD